MTDREGMHIAQVLQMGLRENGRADSEATNYPEKKYVDNMKLHSTGLTVKRAVVALSVIGLVAFGCLLLSKKKKK